MVLVGNLFQAAVSIVAGILHAGDRLGPWTLVVMTLLLGGGQALAMPAYHSVIQDVVPRHLVAAAVTLHSGVGQRGPRRWPRRGRRVHRRRPHGTGLPAQRRRYFALCVVALRIPPPRAPSGPREPMSHAMRTGVRFVRNSPSLLKVFLVSGLFALTSANLQALLAPVADSVAWGRRATACCSAASAPVRSWVP